MNSPYVGAVKWNPAADNDWLVRETVRACRAAWPRIAWPKSIPREDAARVAFDYARGSVQYVREDGDQLIRLPWRTVEDGTGDCKSLSVLIASLCAAAGCRVALRFAAYPGEDWYGHVYAVVDGVPVDPELQFGKEVLSSHTLNRRIR